MWKIINNMVTNSSSNNTEREKLQEEEGEEVFTGLQGNQTAIIIKRHTADSIKSQNPLTVTTLDSHQTHKHTAHTENELQCRLITAELRL